MFAGLDAVKPAKVPCSACGKNFTAKIRDLPTRTQSARTLLESVYGAPRVEVEPPAAFSVTVVVQTAEGEIIQERESPPLNIGRRAERQQDGDGVRAVLPAGADKDGEEATLTSPTATRTPAKGSCLAC
jgi:hypothetical protein